MLLPFTLFSFLSHSISVAENAVSDISQPTVHWLVTYVTSSVSLFNFFILVFLRVGTERTVVFCIKNSPVLIIFLLLTLMSLTWAINIHIQGLSK